MSAHGPLGIGLQARVDGGHYLEAVGVDVISVAVEVGKDCAHLRAEHVAEVRRQARAVVDAVVPDAQRLCLIAGKACGVDVAHLSHAPQHHVAPLERPFGVEARIVGRVGCQHSHQRGGGRRFEPLALAAEEEFRRRLDAVDVLAKRHRVQIERQNLLLGVGALDAVGNNQLAHLGHRDGERPQAASRKEVLGQLLADGAAAALTVVGHQHRAKQHASHAHHVDAAVLKEAAVFGGHKGVDHVGRYVFGVDADAVFDIEPTHQHTVGGVDLGGVRIADARQLGTRGYVPEDAHIDHPHKNGRKNQHIGQHLGGVDRVAHPRVGVARGSEHQHGRRAHQVPERAQSLVEPAVAGGGTRYSLF